VNVAKAAEALGVGRSFVYELCSPAAPRRGQATPPRSSPSESAACAGSLFPTSGEGSNANAPPGARRNRVATLDVEAKTVTAEVLAASIEHYSTSFDAYYKSARNGWPNQAKKLTMIQASVMMCELAKRFRKQGNH
jgi:hypothetical protein